MKTLSKNLARYFSSGRMHEITKNIEEEKTATKGNQLKKIIAKFILSHPNDTIQASDSVDYFRQRLNNETTVDQAQTRVLTKLFTFPLTLSYGINKLFPECNRGSDLENLQILILGGRSESSLPMTWWKEALYSTKKIPRNILIRIIGPDIAITPKDSTVTWVCDNSSHLSTLTISRLDKIDRTLFHDHPHCFQLMNWAHLFVMFNPGFGYDALSESWDATLRLLLQTKKPIMATSHGSYDLQRDLRNLTFQPGNEPLQRRVIMEPHENPFASLQQTIDYKEHPLSQIVTPNQFIYAFCGK